MNTSIRRRLGVATLALAACAVSAVSRAQEQADEVPADSAVASQSQLWPSRFYVGDDAFTVYPLQLERWERDRLDGRAAVAVQAAGADRPIFGVVSVSARTDVDQASGMVSVHDIEASSGSFPTAAGRAATYVDAVRRHLSTLTWQVPLDRLEADLAIDQAADRGQSQPLHNDPPRIVYVQSPTILVPIDGEPVLREMEGLGLRRVLNTRALILQEGLTSRYFLYVAGYWLEAPALQGPWTEAQVRPSALDTAKEQTEAAGVVDLLDDDDSASSRAPKVVVSTGPTELVQTDGPPQYAPIGRTDLLFVTNSPNRLFLDLRTQMHYVLLAGRWYRTPSLARGPWDYVPGADLPADFALIPDEHPTESVRVAVPGTPQAQEATIANSVPEFATVTRSAARLELTYDGAPQFRPIEGTSLEAAVNAPVPVIRVDWRTYYALDNGVWFFSDSPDGPWTAAASVPPVVYTIPRSDPLHHVTYVRVYDATPDEIYVGYTPGYVGSYVTFEGTVVYGSGWYYRPWIGTVWYAPPLTWGFGFSFWYSWWDPWPYPAWWWAWRPVPCYRPAWGPWPHHHVGVKHPGVPHHGAAVVPAKPWPHKTRPAVAPTRLHDRNAFHPNGTGVRDIYRRWDPKSAANGRSGPRPDPQRAARPTRDRDARVSPPASRQTQERRYDRNQRLGEGQQPRVDAPRWVRPDDRVNPPDRGVAPSSPGARADRNQRFGDGQRPRPDAPQRVRPQERATPPGQAAAPSSPGARADRNQRFGDGQWPRPDAPQRVRPQERATPPGQAATPGSPGARADRNQRFGDGQRPRPDTPQRVRPEDGGRPHDRAAAPSSPGLRGSTRPQADAPDRAPAAGAMRPSPGLSARNPTDAGARQRSFDSGRRVESQTRTQPEVRPRGSREDAAPPAVHNPRPSTPPRGQQQRSQNTPSAPRDAMRMRDPRGAPARQSDSRGNRTWPSAAATAPGTGTATPQPQGERALRDPSGGSRSGSAVNPRQAGAKAR